MRKSLDNKSKLKIVIKSEVSTDLKSNDPSFGITMSSNIKGESTMAELTVVMLNALKYHIEKLGFTLEEALLCIISATDIIDFEKLERQYKEMKGKKKNGKRNSTK